MYSEMKGQLKLAFRAPPPPPPCHPDDTDYSAIYVYVSSAKIYANGNEDSDNFLLRMDTKNPLSIMLISNIIP